MWKHSQGYTKNDQDCVVHRGYHLTNTPTYLHHLLIWKINIELESNQAGTALGQAQVINIILYS